MLRLGGHVGWTVMTSSAAAELQMKRGEYLNAMALADRLLTVWFSCRLGVAAEEQETFIRLVEIGNLAAGSSFSRSLTTPASTEM